MTNKRNTLLLTDDYFVESLLEEDIDVLYEIVLHPKVMKFIGPTLSKEEAIAYFSQYAFTSEPTIYGIFTKEKEELIGYFLYRFYDYHSIEIGWVIKDEYRFKGIATMLTKAALDHCKALNYDCIISCAMGNTIAQAIAQKFGFLYEGTHNLVTTYRKSLRRKLPEKP
ncbi:MAG: GNAT family N-acetyltransferase [Solobacterium sp.]|nr:GNAT family N-acetyltransferase [Solobacterium sp.]